MKNFQAKLDRLQASDTEVLGVSVDTPFSNHKFAEENSVTFPLLSDPDGKVIDQYGLLKTIPVKGKDAAGQEVTVPMKTARRATFLIDKEGKIIEEQVDNEAVDPTKVVEACERRRIGK